MWNDAIMRLVTITAIVAWSRSQYFLYRALHTIDYLMSFLNLDERYTGALSLISC